MQNKANQANVAERTGQSQRGKAKEKKFWKVAENRKQASERASQIKENQPSNQPTNQPINQSINQPINKPTNQPTNLPTYQPTNQPTSPSQQTTTSLAYWSWREEGRNDPKFGFKFTEN